MGQIKNIKLHIVTDIKTSTMPSVLQASLLSEVKGHHVYRHQYHIGQVVICRRETDNAYSRDAIVVKSVNGETVGHVPEAIARIINPLWRDGLIQRVKGKIMGNSRSAPEGMWVRGGGIELPCKYKVYGPHQHS